MHVDKADGTVKFWLNPIRVAFADGMKAKELKRAIELAEAHHKYLLEQWHEYFQGKS